MSAAALMYRRSLRDRRLSTLMWALGLVGVILMTAAFYSSTADATAESLEDASGAMSTLLGLNNGIDPTSPLGFLWISLYANVVPMTLMALGIAAGTAAIAGDESTGVLEYTLARPVTRTIVALSRFAVVVTVLFVVAALTALSLSIAIPLFELGDDVTSTLADGSTVTAPGATATDIFAGTFAAFAVGVGTAGVAYLIGCVTGRRGFTIGLSSAIAVGGYVLYTLSESTGSLEALTWISPWRWYLDDAMLINGLTWDVLLPFALALVCMLGGWQALLRRDLQNP